MKSKKIILDTNLWISFLIAKDFSFLDEYIETGKVKLVFSKELIQEFLVVSHRPKFQKHFTYKDIEHLLLIFDKFGVLVEVTSKLKLCRDNKDDFLLNLATDSNADYLVTGDNDLLEIKNVQKTRILTISELREGLA
ncbi:MAG TPA: putative toxin-antitoxin system toxin component, PIN family [Bacteroidales bacterium]|nr:putative toxin-antitoxin system toxin component, PIN family [Bacteroidales bacterium]